MFSALSFTAPFMLAALAALPVLWFLLRATPPSPKQERFPAFIILRQLTTSEETPDRTPWQLLLLRLLLTALIILALAGPVLNAPPEAPGNGPIALIIDDSWGAAANWKARQDAVREAAAEAAQSDREIFMMTTAPGRAQKEIAPMTGEEARQFADRMTPQPFAADRSVAVERLSVFESYNDRDDFDIRWLSDGVAGEGAKEFADALAKLGDVTLFDDVRAPKPILRAVGQDSDGPIFRVERLNPVGPWDGAVLAAARDGRELARITVALGDGEAARDITLDLPLALRNELSSVRIENAASAAAVQLVDARDRRALVGLIAEAAPAGGNLLSGSHYLREALGPYAAFIEDDLNAILASDASVIILDDIGALRVSDVDALTAWIEKGGVLIRFAGPVLAEVAQDLTPPLLPVSLRGGGRAFGGALTWETPQLLDVFPGASPFADLSAPDDVFIRRQVLAEPGGETTTRTWARLKDGTPLVTGMRQGAGVIALFHVTATPQWSDLPIAGIFVDMLRQLTFLSALGPEDAQAAGDVRFAPLRLMDGFGRLQRPRDDDIALTAAEMNDIPGPGRRPGFYGSPDAPLALNVIRPDTPYERLAISGVARLPYAAAAPIRLALYLIVAALALFLIDGLAALLLAGKLRFRRASVAAAIVLAIVAAPAPDAMAQPLDPVIDQKTLDAALTTRLAFIETGDPAMDRLSAQALAGLSRELHQRTALEPGPPAKLDPETDDLSVYPFIYWPVVPGAEAPSEAALANIENFMRFGGLILFDTRDDERAISANSTPEAAALQRILSQLNIAPLAPVDREHVLTRSFYLLPSLLGRVQNNPVWVAAQTSGATDSVTPLIIGGRDWAGAWAVDSFGRPVRPMARGGERARELAYRSGINIVMVAFTGNYKSDQVHTSTLLERLGR